MLLQVMPEHEILKLCPLLKANLLLKGQTQKWRVLAHTLKVAILTSYKKNYTTHLHTLGISETCFTSCKNV